MVNNIEFPDALFMMYLVVKVFYVSNQLQMCPHLMQENNLDPWIQFFLTIINMKMPENLISETNSTDEIRERDKSIHWKIKGLTTKLIYRFFVKYGNPKLVENSTMIKSFSNNFSFKFSNTLIESNLQILLSRKNGFVGTKTLSFSIKFISCATK